MKNPDKGWFPRLTAIEFLGMTESTWDHRFAPNLPQDIVRHESGRRTFINGPMLIKFMMQQATESVGDEADLLAGTMGASPELIAQKIKTQIKLMNEQIAIRAIDRRAKEESFVDRNAVHEAFSRVAGFVRAGIDKLQKTFGAEAFDIMTEKIQDAEDYIKHRFGDFTAGDSGGEPSSDSVDEAPKDPTIQ